MHSAHIMGNNKYFYHEEALCHSKLGRDAFCSENETGDRSQARSVV